MKTPRSPLVAALITFALIVVVGAVVAFLALRLTGRNDALFARGRLVGQGLAPLALAGAGLAWWLTKRKRDRGE